MTPTLERSRTCLQSSNPSTTGSIRSSRIRSGASVSSICSTRSPSVETSVSKPRTARFERIKSTMFGSSSTTRIFVGGGPSDVREVTVLRVSVRRVGSADRQMHAKAGPAFQVLAHDLSLMGLDDPAGNRESQSGAGTRTITALARVDQPPIDLRRKSDFVVAHPDEKSASRVTACLDSYMGALGVIAQCVLEQVDEHLLEAVMVGPDDGQVGLALDVNEVLTCRRDARHGRVDHRRELAPVRLQTHRRGLDRGEVEQVVDEPVEPRRLSTDPTQEAPLRIAVPGDVGGHQARGVAADRRQRSSQLVAEAREEAALELALAPQRARFLASPL